MTADLGGPESVEQVLARHARAARSLVEDACAHGDRPWLLAFPAVADDVSNRLCARAGFRGRGGEHPFRGRSSR